MSIQEIVNAGRNRQTLRGRFGNIIDKVAGNSIDLLGSLKGDVVVRKMMASEEDETKNMIRNILLEFGGISIDSYYFDESLEYLLDTYSETGSKIMIALKNGEVIGSVAIKPFTCSDGHAISGVCELNHYFVKSNHRGQGIGCKLLEKVLSEASNMGYNVCHVNANSVFKNLEAILAHCGFETSDLKVKQCGEKAFDRQLIKTLD